MTLNLATDAPMDSLTEIEIGEIEREIQHLPDRQSAAIDALKIVQVHRGWISDNSLAAIAELLGMSVDELDGIATFYNLIYRQPVGENVILFCDSVSCWLMDGEKVCKKLSEKLEIEFGQKTRLQMARSTTKDGKKIDGKNFHEFH